MSTGTSTPAFAIFTDLHLGVHQDNDFWLDEAKKFVKWFIEDTKSKKIDTVVFGGDLFECRSEISVKTLDAAKEINDMFKASHIKVIHSIAGNHDCYYRDHNKVNSLKLMGAPFLVYPDTTTGIYIGGLSVSFVPWGCSIPTETSDILIGHFDSVGFKVQKTNISKHGFSPSELVDKAKLVLSGHYHLRQRKTYANGEMVYVGNPFQTTFGDAEEMKGYMIVNSDGFYEWVDYQDSVQHHYITYSKMAEQMDEIKDKRNLSIALQFDTTPDDISAVIDAFKLKYKPKFLRTDNITENDDGVQGEIIVTSTMSKEELFTSFLDGLSGYDTELKSGALEYIKSKLS